MVTNIITKLKGTYEILQDLPPHKTRYWILRRAIIWTGNPTYGCLQYQKLQHDMTTALKQAETLKVESTGEIASVEERYQLLAKLLRDCDNGLQLNKPNEILEITTKGNTGKGKERCLVYFHTGKCTQHSKGKCPKFRLVFR